LQELQRTAGEHDAPAVENLLHGVTGGYHPSLPYSLPGKQHPLLLGLF
jgi:hypothetical protein